MEWEDGELIEEEDVQEKTKEIIKLFKMFINEKLESDDNFQHKSFDTMPETWYKNGKIDALQELVKKEIVVK